MKTKHFKTALLLINIQNDYFYKGKMELQESYENASHAKKVLETFRKRKKTVIHVQHLAVQKNASYFIPGTFGAEIYQEVKPAEGEKIIIKNHSNSFAETELFEYLLSNEINHLTIAGMMSNMHVDSTVTTAKDLGFKVELISKVE